MTATQNSDRRRWAPVVSLCALAALVLTPSGVRAAGSDKSGSTQPNTVIVSTTVAPIWPSTDQMPSLDTIGRRVAIVFSPDFSVPTNRLFYERLGFLYLEDANWENVLGAIERFNAENPDRAVETVIVTTHGANGNGLKLQESKEPGAGRSYVSIGALQERLGRAGATRCVIAACNVARLFRPGIYNTIDRTAVDPLFLPATLGVVDASPEFDASKSGVAVIRRADNPKENTTEGSAAELSPATRRALGLDDPHAVRFVVSDLFVQMLTNDATLRLTSGGYVSHVTKENPSNARSNRYFNQFVRALDSVASRQS